MGHCRSCKYYEFSGENSKGLCSWYNAYYYADDSCKHYEEGSSSGSGWCFLTTACCKYKGLPDDCAELETLRRFRDNYLKGRNTVRSLYEPIMKARRNLLSALTLRRNETIFTTTSMKLLRG